MPVVIHGLDEVNKWVVGIHDVVIKVGQQVVNHNRVVGGGMRMRWSELKRMDVEINSSACSGAHLPGILAVHPQVVWVVISGMNPAGKLGLFTLLYLLREIVECFSDLIRGVVAGSTHPA